MTLIRSYAELTTWETFLERYHYLALRGMVGEATFGHDRYLNQAFYRSMEWRRVRNHIIARDNGCDLGIEGREIHGRLVIHHMNPMTPHDIIHGEDSILNPSHLITVSHDTHNAIHYGDEKQLPRPFVERSPGDTTLWSRST